MTRVGIIKKSEPDKHSPEGRANKPLKWTPNQRLTQLDGSGLKNCRRVAEAERRHLTAAVRRRVLRHHSRVVQDIDLEALSVNSEC